MLTVAFALGTVTFGACSADGGNSGSGAGNGSGAGSGVGGDGSLFGGSSAQGGAGGGCVGISKKAEKIPLAMYIMLDQSGSMSGELSNGDTQWEAVTAALTSFVEQPGAAGISVGIQYFPLDGNLQCPVVPFCWLDADCEPCGPCDIPMPGMAGVCAGDESCDIAVYSTPEVPIAPLPGVAGAIVNSMAAHGPTGGTPTSAALQGAIDHAIGWNSGNPDFKVIVVLATDGNPTDCDTDLNNINAIAAAGANGVPQILTFVIGVGDELTALNGIAAAGGTNQAFLVDTAQDVTQQFLDALNVIQGAALGCSYTIPEPDQGTVNPSQVNVQYTPGDGSGAQTIPFVQSPADCPPGGDGWYYDNNVAPTQIIMCDGTCEKISLDISGEIDIVLGCSTIAR